MNTAMNRKNPHLKSSGKEDKMIGFKDIYKILFFMKYFFIIPFHLHPHYKKESILSQLKKPKVFYDE